MGLEGGDMLNEERRRIEIATFRFGVIGEFVTGAHLTYGEKERLLREKSARKYSIPYAKRTRVSRETILKWIRDYENSGKSLEALYPKTRADKGRFKTLAAEIQLGIKEILRENPRRKALTILNELKHRKVIGAEVSLNRATIYRYLQTMREELPSPEAKDRRLYEAELPNEVWQSDVMHGPYVGVEGRKRKAYLIAFIDDHSRFIVHGEFYLNESFETFRLALKTAVEKHGLPQKLYVDNGSCFRSVQLEHTAAQLGIVLTHSRPYVPQGRGKIERWFRTVRDQFLDSVFKPEMTLENLNVELAKWVSSYNRTVHGTTGKPPKDRYHENLKCFRPAPQGLQNFFRIVQHRTVKKDRSFKLRGRLFEAPVGLIDKNIELRFFEADLTKVEIFFDGKTFGPATLLDPHLNAKLGRNWMVNEKREKERNESPPTLPPTGKLPLGGES